MKDGSSISPEREAAVPRISCHHGDIRRPNSLTQARAILDQHPEIDIMEIDFVAWHGELLSAHDYTHESVATGSPLSQWVAFVVVESRRILWFDLKARLDAKAWLCDCAYAIALLCAATLTAALERHAQELDLRQYMILTCQDRELKGYLQRLCGCQGWLFADDLPFVDSYIWQWLLPQPFQWLVNRHVQALIAHYDLSAGRIVSIDLSFFEHNLDLLQACLRLSSVRGDALLILYNFPLSQAPIKIPGYRVVMQYDYTLQV
jgi:hypothetical protein